MTLRIRRKNPKGGTKDLTVTASEIQRGDQILKTQHNTSADIIRKREIKDEKLTKEVKKLEKALCTCGNLQKNCVC